MSVRVIFHNGTEVRAGWRLLVFCALLFGIGYAARTGTERLPLLDYADLHPVGLILDDAVMLVVALVATGIMARFEHRSLTTYGLPRLRELFGRLFWMGTMWGLAMPSATIVLIFIGGGYRVHGLHVAGG